jgi:signal transduction histidine kinase
MLDEKQRSPAVFPHLIGHIDDLVITIDRAAVVGFVNQPILGLLPEQIIGTSFYDYVRPYELKRFRLAIDRAFASGTNTDFINEGLVSFPAGKHFRVRVKSLPLESTVRKAGKTRETETAMVVFADITDQQQAEEQLKRMQHNRKRVARRASLIREEERTRLASELHDQLGQELTVAKLYLSMVWQKGNNREFARSAIQSAESAVDRLMILVREVSAELRPPLLERLGFVAALQLHLKTFRKRTGIRCKFSTRTREVFINTEIATGVFRVFQETLTNVIRHSRASEVEVRLDVHRGSLCLTVSDNGRGITEAELYSPKSLGLIGMRERAQQVGGTIHIQNGWTEGTTVVIQVPLSSRFGPGQVRKQR